MPIPSATLAELNGHLSDGVDAADLENAYTFDHLVESLERNLNNTSNIQYQSYPSALRWRVEMRTDKGEVVTEDGRDGFERMLDCYSHQKDLTRGPVVHRERLYLHPLFQRKGLGGKICLVEEDLYRSWGVKEIHLEAARQGKVVWIKKFGFKFWNRGIIEDEYERWANTNSISTPFPPDEADLPEDFLKALKPFKAYKVL